MGPTPVTFLLVSVLLASVISPARFEDIAHFSFGGTRCPRVCNCIGATVDCSRRGLTAVPRNIPLDTERLWVLFKFFNLIGSLWNHVARKCMGSSFSYKWKLYFDYQWRHELADKFPKMLRLLEEDFLIGRISGKY